MQELPPTVVVMPQYNGIVPNIEGVDAEDETEIEDTEFEPSTETDLSDGARDNDSRLSGGIAIVVIIILIGALIYVLFFLNKRNRI